MKTKLFVGACCLLLPTLAIAQVPSWQYTLDSEHDDHYNAVSSEQLGSQSSVNPYDGSQYDDHYNAVSSEQLGSQSSVNPYDGSQHDDHYNAVSSEQLGSQSSVNPYDDRIGSIESLLSEENEFPEDCEVVSRGLKAGPQPENGVVVETEYKCSSAPVPKKLCGTTAAGSVEKCGSLIEGEMKPALQQRLTAAAQAGVYTRCPATNGDGCTLQSGKDEGTCVFSGFQTPAGALTVDKKDATKYCVTATRTCYFACRDCELPAKNPLLGEPTTTANVAAVD